ncbi:MAG: thiamine pyrophosphate-binding protein [Candidatus Omnitrophica bacterium]|nr:thiamine pyrophosphate-binding protein [Candidatus Omnitrophota bacterium]
MKVSDFVIDFLVKEKVTHIFEVCGGALAHLLDSLYGRKDILTISVHHEQAAAIAAEGYARIKGDVGVAMATSGPGATNMITGIASCYFDSVPAVFITGQVNTYEFKFNKPVRQIGFQETDIVGIVKPIVKEAILVKDPSKIKYYLEKAFFLARSGRPGPVLLDIPLDVQRAEINPRSSVSFKPEQKSARMEARLVKDIARSIISSKRPVILVGGGVVLSKADKELARLVSLTGIPVVSSLLGLDAAMAHKSTFVGMIGTYGNRYANLATANSDLLLCLGTRLDTRQTGTKPETFARKAIKIHVDIDKYELNNKLKVDFPVRADIKAFLQTLNGYLKQYDPNKTRAWREKIKYYKERFPSHALPSGETIHPNFFVHQLSVHLPKDTAVCTDIGQNQIWSAQSMELKKGCRFLTQGGMGTMGSALPLAIGASFAKALKPVVAITGDGGFQLNIQELQTIIHHRLPVKIILLNNSCYGMVRQFQEQYFNSRFQSTAIGYSYPDFQKVVSAYKIPVKKISKNSQVPGAIKHLFATKGPSFLEVIIPRKTQVLPKLSVNKPIEDQDPALSRPELSSLLTKKQFR